MSSSLCNKYVHYAGNGLSFLALKALSEHMGDKTVYITEIRCRNKKLSWCWQTRATRLVVSQGHQTWYHSIC